jgi:hypothetical protein
MTDNQPENIISTYPSQQAVEDGILFDVTTVSTQWKSGLLRYVTTNLLRKYGYMTKIVVDGKDEEEVNTLNLVDLLNQSITIIRTKSEGFTKPDWYFKGEIETPSGTKQPVVITLNEEKKFTVMCPEDY